MKQVCRVGVFCWVLLIALTGPAQAADVGAGSKIFTANCAVCHAGGNNLVISTKNLRKETLEKYEMFSAPAIQTQVMQGKNAMPAFGERLSDTQIEDVAAYVLAQAERGWS